MLKIIKNKTFIAILLCIGFFTVGVKAATMYYSNEISYTPSDSNWNVKNVEEALDSLYLTKKQTTDYDLLYDNAISNIEATGVETLYTLTDKMVKYIAETRQLNLRTSESGNISWDSTIGPSSKKITSSYTPSNDCNYMCYAYPDPARDDREDYVSSTMPGTRIINAKTRFVNVGTSKAGETITCDYSGHTSVTYMTLNVDIYTDNK